MSWWRKNGIHPLTVICCSIPEIEPERALKFFRACEMFEASGMLVPFIEIRKGFLNGLEHLDLVPYKVAFTHNRIGEYGHIHHTQVHNFVKKSRIPVVFNFGYGTQDGQELQFNSDDKFNAIQCYDHKSAVAGVPKWRELMQRWGNRFDLTREKYIRIR